MWTFHETASLDPAPSRRRFLRLLIGTAVTAAGLLAVPTLSARLPKPQNQIDADQALARLMEGNARYTQGLTRRHDFLPERDALSDHQNPYAAILSCADSRVAPEFAFDTMRGDIFAVRIAGNFVTEHGLASLEYAVAVLGAPLLMVLGHEGCGAINAGIKAIQEGAGFPGQIGLLAQAVSVSVQKALRQDTDVREEAVRQNVMDNVQRLRTASAVIADAVAARRLKVVGGLYRIRTGQVELLPC